MKKQLKAMARAWVWLAVVPALALLSACGGAGTTRAPAMAETGTVQIQITWPTSTASSGLSAQSATYKTNGVPTAVATVRATVTVGTFTASQSGPADVWAATPQSVVTPVGTGTLKIDALNSAGSVLYSGSTTISVAPNSTVQVVVLVAPVVPPVGPLMSLQVTPATASIVAGTTQQYVAIGTYADKSTQDVSASVTWNADTSGVATISAAGLATGVTPGTASINATLGSITSNTAALTVTAVTLVSVQVTPATVSISAGMTKQFKATAIYADNSIQDVTGKAQWSSDTPTVATISDTGLATGLPNDNATVSTNITATVNGIVSNVAVLSVVPTPLASITITPATANVTKGTTQIYTATGNYTDGTTRDLTGIATWVSDEKDVAIITGAGMATGVEPGKANITATLGMVTSDASVLTVLPTPLASLAVTPTPATIAAGTKQRYAATATYVDNSTMDVTASVSWGSSNTSVATIGTSGVATGVVPGSVTITATLGGVTSNAAALTVTPAVVTAIQVTPATASLQRCAWQQYAATATLSDNSTQDLTLVSSWIANPTSVATISAKGKATGVTAGSASITASYKGVVSNAASLTVTAAGRSEDSEARHCDHGDDDDDNRDGDR